MKQEDFNRIAAQVRREMGKKGGFAAAARMTPKQRHERAKKAAIAASLARWLKNSPKNGNPK